MAITLYDLDISGHAHRIRLFLSLLGIEHDLIPVNMMEGEHKSPQYRKLNPLGQVPTLIDGDTVITDSCAALVYLALKYGDDSWYPRDPAGAARVQRWLSSASGELYRGPVMARAICKFDLPMSLDAAHAQSHRLFRWMQLELSTSNWLAAEHATIADLAMYSYIRVADEGELDTSKYPAIETWMVRVESLPGFVGIPRAADLN